MLIPRLKMMFLVLSRVPWLIVRLSRGLRRRIRENDRDFFVGEGSRYWRTMSLRSLVV